MSIRDHQPDPVHWSLRFSYKREERLQPPPQRTTLEYLSQAVNETVFWGCDPDWCPACEGEE